ncbi:hypothetical protein ACFL12_00125 [Pseudomonadota bacterium]
MTDEKAEKIYRNFKLSAGKSSIDDYDTLIAFADKKKLLYFLLHSPMITITVILSLIFIAIGLVFMWTIVSMGFSAIGFVVMGVLPTAIGLALMLYARRYYSREKSNIHTKFNGLVERYADEKGYRAAS